MAWFALVAEFSKGPEGLERRGAERRKLRFESMLTATRPPAKVVVLDLSEAGFMFHADEDLALQEVFEVELPQAGAVEAQVLWKRSTLYGCKFLSPVSRGTISAVMLQARYDPSSFDT
jgi:hypothetical protein